MLTATLLALGAAVLHAGWNLWVKQSGDRWIALWGQMTSAGLVGCVILLIVGGAQNIAWWQFITSGSIHVLYIWALSRAYNLGDFSVTYPIARGTGALVAAIGGVLFLSDSLSALTILGIVVSVFGVMLLAGRADNSHVRAALLVSVTIGAYSVVDSHGSRQMGGNLYPILLFIATGTFLTVAGLANRRSSDMVAAMRSTWHKFTVAGAASMLTYWMVLLTVQRAPVGYVTALRESSVVIVALVGTRYLGEQDMKRRVLAACIVVTGLCILVLGR